MSDRKTTARIAGLLYLLVAITGAFSMLIVPALFIVPGDVVATAGRIQASELLFRAGIVSGLACQIVFIFLVLALRRLLGDVDRGYAAAMTALVMVSVPIAFLNMLNRLAALILLSGAGFLSALDTAARHALVLFFLELHDQGIAIVQLFWGLWLFPFGILVYRSGFLPRVLGILLVIACVAYVTDSVTTLLFPRYTELVSSLTGAPAGIGELAIMLWLLIAGARAEAH